MKVFLATKNKKKLLEMQGILMPLGIEVLSEINSDYKIEDVEETGTTFEENAYIKAKSACDATNLPSFADDSGLCVDVLNGQPGIYSARFAGLHQSDEDNNKKLLDLLKNTEDSKRTAKFVSSICCCFPNGDIVTGYGECHGYIGRTLKGDGGFGYDQLFIVGDKTFAEMTQHEKDQVSHRGKAIEDFIIKLKKYLGDNNVN